MSFDARRIVQSLGGDLSGGVAEDEIFRQEAEIGMPLPSELREWYLSLGRNELFADAFHHVTRLEDLRARDGIVMFATESQAVVAWGIPISSAISDNLDSVLITDDGVLWRSLGIGVGEFLSLLIYQQVVMGEQTPTYVRCRGGNEELARGHNWREVVEHDGLSVFESYPCAMLRYDGDPSEYAASLDEVAAAGLQQSGFSRL